MYLHQASEGRNRPHGYLAFLWFAHSEAHFRFSTLTNMTTDSSAFMVIFGLAAKSGLMGRKMPRILRAIVQDATIYFLVIFTSHFVLEMTILLARVSVFVSGDSNDVEISPAESSTPASYVSARFETHQ